MKIFEIKIVFILRLLFIHCACISCLFGCAHQADIERSQYHVHQVLSQETPWDREVSPSPHKTYPKTRNFEGSLALPEAEFDLALSLLLFADRYGSENVDVEGWLTVLDAWADKLAFQLHGVRGENARIYVLRSFIHDQLGFAFDHQDASGLNPENLFFDRVLARKRGYCVTLSMVYLVLAERVGIKLAAVRLPRHFAVMSEEKEKEQIIETTKGGRPRSYVELYSSYTFAREAVEKHGVYLTKLNRESIFSTLFNNLGGLAALANYHDAALEAFNQAIELSPKNLEARYNRAGVLMKFQRSESFDQALFDLNESLRLNPDFYHAYCRRADLYDLIGQSQAAAQDLMRAKTLKPTQTTAYIQEGIIAYRAENYSLAQQRFEEALKYDSEDRDALRNLILTELQLGNQKRAQELEVFEKELNK